nr:MAG TPA: hypothetical protein [Caudoviricetes sp.]
MAEPEAQRAEALKESACPVGTWPQSGQSDPQAGSETSGGRGQRPPRRLSDREGMGPARKRAAAEPVACTA